MSCQRAKTRRQLATKRRVQASKKKQQHVAARTPAARITKPAKRQVHKLVRRSASRRPVSRHGASHHRPKTTTTHPARKVAKNVAKNTAKSRALSRTAHAKAVTRARTRANVRASSRTNALRRHVAMERRLCRLLLRKAAQAQARARAKTRSASRAQKAQHSLSAQQHAQALRELKAFQARLGRSWSNIP